MMRWLSALLVFCLSYTFAHEALCHGGAVDMLTRCLSYAGSQQDHDGHAHTGHDHQPKQTDPDTDHHDDKEHDHQLKTLLAKKDPSSHRWILLSPADALAHSIPHSAYLAVASGLDSSAHPGAESSVPGYLRAHVLRL
jgi:hypothetical protein